MTSLHRAVQNNHANVVEILLANNAEVNLKTPHGSTSLFEAVDKGYTQVIIIYIEYLS